MVTNDKIWRTELDSFFKFEKPWVASFFWSELESRQAKSY